MTRTSDTADRTEGGLELPSAADMRDIIERKNREKAAEELKKRTAAEEEKKHQEEILLARKLTPEFINLIMRRVHDAAESGASEIMIGKFPCALCTDGGRKINAPEESWPDTLQGIAREFFEFWERNLKPRGFRLRVQILDFPGGKPGDVGAFLSWKA
jgi:hypothetical protein